MEIQFKRDTAFRKQFFVPDSFAHPAKMDAQLLIWIVERYTEVGEIILDPMAGMGTTMLACGLGRNVVLNELEGKFCTMMFNNWGQVRMRPQLGYQMGECQIIQGDARNLEGLLVDEIITSPPYAGDKGGEKGILANDPSNNPFKGRSYIPNGTYSVNESNISNLPYGQIDKIVTSPPFAGHSGGKGEASSKSINAKYPGICERHLGGKKGGTGDNPDNIDSFPYGNIDTVITSPPYEGSKELHDVDFMVNTAGDQQKRTANGVIKGHSFSQEARERVFQKRREGLPESIDNIGNLKSQSYLEAMLQVYQQCHKILKPNGLMILVTKNFIRNKQVIRLDLDTIKLCEQAGFGLLERHYRKLPSQSFWRIIYHQKHPEVELIDKEDILVFRQVGR